MLPNSSEPEA
jgi:hypothetical protein